MIDGCALLSPAGARAVTPKYSRRDEKSLELLSPTGARVVTIIINLPYYTSRALLSPAGARAVTVTGSYYTGGSTLLSPAGARAVTRMNTRRRSVERGCCPPQGRELLRDVMRIFVRNILALLSPAGARVVTNYIKTVLKEAQGCCPPQGRELLRQKCEKYNADFRHSYNLFVLSSVFLRIHS